jgi:hypothetical protein
MGSDLPVLPSGARPGVARWPRARAATRARAGTGPDATTIAESISMLNFGTSPQSPAVKRAPDVRVREERLSDVPRALPAAYRRQLLALLGTEPGSAPAWARVLDVWSKAQAKVGPSFNEACRVNGWSRSTNGWLRSWAPAAASGEKMMRPIALITSDLSQSNCLSLSMA